MTRIRNLLGRLRGDAARKRHDIWRTLFPTTGGIAWQVVEAKRLELTRRRTFGPADLEALDALAAAALDVVPVREFVARGEDRQPRLLGMRHDMDHDLENSLRFAAWEAARGIRSTYYVLHTDWYWGARPDRPSRFVLRALARIASLGHEIGVHNNAITAALRTGGDPVRILDGVLSGLRRRGFDVVGTVAHGDPLCRVAGYINNELFVECSNPTYGPPDRTIVYQDRTAGTDARLKLRPVRMAELGLTYEANFVGHPLYLSDAGGHWNWDFDALRQRFTSGGEVLQVLAHPVWWAFQGELVRSRPAGKGVASGVPTDAQ